LGGASQFAVVVASPRPARSQRLPAARLTARRWAAVPVTLGHMVYLVRASLGGEFHMSTLFFSSSSVAWDEITETFDFVWPTAVAIWNLRWQVTGYVNNRPEATPNELFGIFAYGSGIEGANLKRAAIEQSWDQQKEQFAKFVLINLIAIYESWIDEAMLVLNVVPAKDINDVKKQLQFPSGGMKNPTKGIWNAIGIITSNESSMLKNAFYQSLLKHRKNSKSNLDNLMRCYRYFKECRNCISHAGGLANNNAVEAYQEFVKVATEADLGLKEVPEYFPIINGQPVRYSLRGVVGFGDVVIRIITTLDAELSRSIGAENEFLQRWKEINGTKYTLKTKDAQARSIQIGRYAVKMGLPMPISTKDIELFIRNHGLVG
jgi:hypothetical protein